MMTLWLILRDRDGNETAVEEDLPGFFFAEETLDDQCDVLDRDVQGRDASLK